MWTRTKFLLQKIKNIIPLLLPLFWISSIFEQLLTKKVEFIINSTEPTTLPMFIYGGLHILNGLLFPLLTMLVTLSCFLPKDNIGPRLGLLFANGSAFQLIKETIRAWGMTFWWFYAFIIPGLYKYLAYSFIPIIVLLDPQYQDGKIDALESSESIFKENWGKLLFLFFILYLIIPFALSSALDSYQNFNDTPLSAFLVSTLNGFLNLIGFLFLVDIFFQHQKKFQT